jgi:hypothetical protein
MTAGYRCLICGHEQEAPGPHGCTPRPPAVPAELWRRSKEEGKAILKKSFSRDEPDELRNMLRGAVLGAGLDDYTVDAQMEAAETEGWEPRRCGPSGEFIYGYRHTPCGKDFAWPGEHECPAGRLTPADVGAA